MDAGNPGKLTDHVSLGALTRTVPRFIVDEVLAETESREKRSRALPAHLVVYFVLALALFTDGYEEVIRKLVNGLRFARVWSREWNVPTTSALSQARKRLGDKPVQMLFERVAVPLARPGTPGAWIRDWRVMALDGVMIDVPDTPENLQYYGKPEGGTRRPFPQTRTVGLAEAGTHAIIAVQLGTIYQGERELTKPLISSFTPEMLITADRGFFSFDMWRDCLTSGAALVWRVSATVGLPVLQVLPDGSYLSEITNQPARSRTRIPLDKVSDPRLATHIPVRVLEYHVQTDPNDETTSEPFRIITNILDPDELHATEAAQAYHERWDLETAFREIETYLRLGKGIRSKTPEMVRQELYGLFLAHYAIRSFMAEAADTVDIDPDRISFTRTLHIIRRRITDPAGLSPLRPENTPPA
jgi:Insertion element 4 transposase N-terminal/Transposase DDE domain